LCIANNAKTTGESEKEDESDQEDGNIPIKKEEEKTSGVSHFNKERP
jgi:hypothetical protein